MDKEMERKCFELAHYIFPDVHETVEDLEVKYPVRRIKKDACVTRYAPSPTGFLHTGALFMALVNKIMAKQSEGIYFVRIEDTDQKREVEGCVKLLTEGLKEFGLTPDEGVISENEEKGYYGPYTQSKRREIYRICAKHLVEKGLAYPCFCTPEMLKANHDAQEKNKVVPGYYGIYAKCRNISIDESIERVKAGEKFILRFRSQGSHLRKTSFIDGARGKIEIAENDQDVVIIKGDGLPTYHFAHVCDDHFMRTTHVVRGEEWISSVPIHLDLANAMGFEPPVYVHAPLILVKEGESKRKLSKRKDKEADVQYFIKAGYPVEAVIEYLYTILNSDFEMWRNKNKEASLDEFKFKLNKMSSAGSLLDMMKLNDISKELISRMTSKEVLDRVLTWSKKYDEALYEVVSKDLEYSRKVFAVERENVKKIRKDIIKWEDIKENFYYFFNELFEENIKESGYIYEFNEKITKDIVKKSLENYIESYNENHTKDEWFANMKEQAEKIGFCTDMKMYKADPDKYIGSTADFAKIIRIAITNKENSPDIYAIMQLLGKNETLNRFKSAKESI